MFLKQAIENFRQVSCKISVLGLNFAKVTSFRYFSFSLTFCSIIYFQYRKNEYVYVN